MKIKNPLKYISLLYSKLTLIQKLIYMGIILIVICSLVALHTLTLTYTWVPVFSSPIKNIMTLAKIVLRINQEEVKVLVTANGIILVTDEATARHMRVILIMENLLPSRITPWEIFNKERWTVTDIVNNVNFRRTQTQMVTEHIKSIEGIDNVSVIVVVPERKLFVSDQEPISASVIIYPKPGSDITKDRKKIEGIQKILKIAVEGLIDENIVIGDYNGLILNNFE